MSYNYVPSNLAKFNAGLARVSKQVSSDELVIVQQKLAFELLSRIVLRHPVKSGRSRGNWQVVIGQTNEIELDEPYKSPDALMNEALAVVSQLKPRQIVYVFNNVPYIVRLEHGWSKQSAEGLVAVSLEELEETFS